ncbi:MAG: serine/threonine protein kinase, partial [Bdellovibrionales bacterium]|nr:serine/threonine protein kinase [Bdellovibrionales bacterium]
MELAFFFSPAPRKNAKYRLMDSFYELTPETVMAGIEQAGLTPTGEYTQLNSYENRVFDIRLEPEGNPENLNGRVIAKFYRPGRWDEATIQEEHDFQMELRDSGLPVVAPLKQANGKTISSCHGMFLGLFPKAIGRMPQELWLNDYERIGRTLARLHNVGELRPAQHRPRLHPEIMGWPSLRILEKWAAPEVWSRYERAAVDILEWLEEALEDVSFQRIHGDCHKGNLLLKQVREEPEEFFLVDFDDFCMGPAVQDFWMLFSGDQETLNEEEQAILSGYEELRNFDDRELDLIPGLRGLRIIHYAAWIARRWEDPSFPRLFPAF